MGRLLSTVTKTNVTCCDAYSSLSVVSCTFSALCMYSQFGHHPHPLCYLCAKFHFFCGLYCWASPWRKLCTQSLTHYLMPREPKRSEITTNYLPINSMTSYNHWTTASANDSLMTIHDQYSRMQQYKHIHFVWHMHSLFILEITNSNVLVSNQLHGSKI